MLSELAQFSCPRPRYLEQTFFSCIYLYMADSIEVEGFPEAPSGDEDESKAERESKESSVSDQLSGSEKSQ